jgi:hypothetical protein
MIQTHKQFQYNISRGTVQVQFTIEDNSNELNVSNIILRSVFRNGLPENPTLEYLDNKWVLGKWYKHENNGFPDVCKYFDNKLTAGIIREIFRIKNEYAKKNHFHNTVI